ncbi:MAG TPA: complex I NDUFA9 subunit family protein, partial [Reyranella sp.]
ASPVVPLIGGGRTRLQPVHADDVAEAACAALRDSTAPGATYEIGGPEAFTLRAIIEMILAGMGRRRLLVPIGFVLADPLARLLERVPRAPLTVAQVDLLRADNVPAPGSPGLAELGIDPPRKLQDILATLAVR